MPGNIASAIVFIVNALVQLYVLVLLLRFCLLYTSDAADD